jgi:hypothetical protein
MLDAFVTLNRDAIIARAQARVATRSPRRSVPRASMAPSR